MSAMTESRLKDEIKTGSLSGTYFLYGEEGFLIKKYVREIKENTVSKTFADFNLATFDGAECPVDDLADFALSVPMMAPKKCAVIKDFNIEKRSANDVSKLYDLLSEENSSCVLVFFTDLLEIGKKPSAKWNAFIKKIEEHGKTLFIPFLDEKELCRTLISGAKKRDCSLDDRLAEYMVMNCGNSLEVLINELDKICSFTGSGEITKDKLEQTIVKTLTVKVFDMVNAILVKNIDKALGILDELFYQRQEPVSILAAISTVYVDIYRARVAVLSGGRAEDIAKIFTYRGTWQLSNADRNGRKLSKSAARGCLDMIINADEKLKSTNTDKKTVLEELLVRLTCIK